MRRFAVGNNVGRATQCRTRDVCYAEVGKAALQHFCFVSRGRTEYREFLSFAPRSANLTNFVSPSEIVEVAAVPHQRALANRRFAP